MKGGENYESGIMCSFSITDTDGPDISFHQEKIEERVSISHLFRSAVVYCAGDPIWIRSSCMGGNLIPHKCISEIKKRESRDCDSLFSFFIITNES